MPFHALIMAGGGGTRLWPLSRQDKPKQSLPLLGEQTMFQIAVRRLAPLFPPERIWVVTSAHYATDFQAQCPELPRANYIIEPGPRNTAPALGLAAQTIAQRDPDATLACLTADHVILAEARFRAVLSAAAEVAAQGHLVTLGITPTYPATGFGYIQRAAPLGEFAGWAAYHAARFKEKPARAEAEALLADGLHTWNSGMFIWQAARFLDEVQRQLPALHQVLTAATAHPAQLPELWPNAPAVSVDYGIMEHAPQVVVIPAADLGWHDIGSWDALFDVLPSDENGNLVIGGAHLAVDTTHTLIHAQANPRLIATIGVHNLVVVDTGDTLLICAKDRAQDVKQVVEELKRLAHGQKYL